MANLYGAVPGGELDARAVVEHESVHARQRLAPALDGLAPACCCTLHKRRLLHDGAHLPTDIPL
jgi:hypothetical protein